MRGQWPGLERGSVSRGRSQGRTMKLSLPWWSQVRAVGVSMLPEIRAGHTWRRAGQAGVRASQETVRGLEMAEAWFSPFQSLLFPRERRWADAACALPPRRPGRPWHPQARPADQHTQPRGGGVCGDHQQPHTPRLHRRQGLREDLGHQPAREQEPHLPAGLPGEDPGASGIPSSCYRRAGIPSSCYRRAGQLGPGAVPH